MAVPTLRALSIGELLDVAIKIAWSRAAVLIPVVAVAVVPTQLVSVLVTLSAPDVITTTVDPLTGDETSQFNAAGLAAFSVTFVLAAAALALSSGACFKAVRDTYLGEQPTVRGSLGYALRRFHSVLWVSFLANVIPAIALLALAVPGIWLWVSFALSVPVLMSEGIRGRRALGRSFRLVRGRWWATFGALVLSFLLTRVVAAVLAASVGALVLVGAGDTTKTIVAGLAEIVAGLITTPFTAAFLTVLYFDLRVRREGFDLELQAKRIAEPDGVAGPS